MTQFFLETSVSAATRPQCKAVGELLLVPDAKERSGYRVDNHCHHPAIAIPPGALMATEYDCLLPDLLVAYYADRIAHVTNRMEDMEKLFVPSRAIITAYVCDKHGAIWEMKTPSPDHEGDPLRVFATRTPLTHRSRNTEVCLNW